MVVKGNASAITSLAISVDNNKMADSSGGETVCRSVQFRGLSTYYVAAEKITVSFRYPTEGFKVDARDWIGLAADADSYVERCVCRVCVGDPTRHRPCDGGVWKVGTVVLTLPQEGGGNYRLRYVRHGGGVVGKSDPFTVCSDLSEFPSITIQSLEDHVFIDKLRGQSPMLLSSNSPNESSSFVLVTEDSHSAPHRKSVDDHHSGNDTVGGSANTGKEGTGNTEERNDRGGTQIEKVTGLDPVIIRVCTSPSGEAQEHVQMEGCTAGERRHCQEEKLTVRVCESPLEVVSRLEDPVGAETGGEGGKQFIKEVDMSESMVLVQGISEREAWRLKQNNKELWIKIRKLSDRMEGLQQENEILKGQLDRERTEKQRMKRRILQLENMAVELEAAKTELEEQGHQIVEEKQSLRVTVGQLQSELMAVSVHCRKLLDQVNESERRVRTVGEENAVLQRQVEEFEKHRRRRKKQEQKAEEGKGREGAEVVDSPKLSRERRRQEKRGVEPGRMVQGSRGRQKHHHRPREERDKVPHSDVSPETKQPRQSSEGMSRKEGGVERTLVEAKERPLSEGRVERTSVEAKERPLSEGRVERTSVEAKERPLSEGRVERTSVEAKERPLSEGRVEEIASCLKGRHVTSYQCPVCQKQLHARENEYSVLLHIEHCLTWQAH